MNAYFTHIRNDALEHFRWQFIECHQQEDTLYLTLNNPERRNALNPIMLNELAYALAYASIQPRLRFVRLRAKGEVFCAGADLKAMMGAVERHSDVPQAEKPIVIDELLADFSKPLILELTGDVLAGGMLLVTGATFVVAHRAVRFSLPEVHRGLFPFQVMKALSAFIPARVVLNWCLCADERTAEQLHTCGLVTHLVRQRDEVYIQTDRLVEQLRAGAPLAMQKGIEAYRWLGMLSHTQLNSMLMELLQSEDAQEGILAFKQKRKPNWKGK